MRTTRRADPKGASYFVRKEDCSRLGKLEPTDDPPNDDPTDVSCMLEPTVEEFMLEPTLESEMLDPTVDC